MAFISIFATFIGLWAYWLFCSLFPLLGGGWMRRYRLWFYVGMLALSALQFAVLWTPEGVGTLLSAQVLAPVAAQLVIARLALAVAYACFGRYVAPHRPPERNDGNVRDTRRLLYVGACILCAAIALPAWTQAVGAWLAGLFA